MAGQLKEIRERMKSVQSTQQITKAMKMVSATKLRKSQEMIIQLRPYSQKLKEVVEDVSAAVPDETEIKYLKQPVAIREVIVICVTSDRGLCGAFNANISKLVAKHIEENYQNARVRIWNIGKKGMETLKRMGYQTVSDYLKIAHPFDGEAIDGCIHHAMTEFVEGKVDAVDIVYSEFKSATVQIPIVETMLPVKRIPQLEGKQNSINSLYLFEQSPTELMNNIIPLSLKVQLLKAILDSSTSEHGARMTSMSKATENANEIFNQLKISYNRVRQSAITTELTEIIAGASAL